MSIHTPKADILRLVDIARVSYKYHFKSLETWALDAINDHVNRKDSALFTFSSLPSPAGFSITRAAFQANSTQLSRLIRLAQLCEHESLLSTMTMLLKRMMKQGIEYAHLAMTLADELDLRYLRGAAYLEVMQKAVVVVRKKGKDGLNEDSEDLDRDILDHQGRLVVSAEQQLRLLTGYYRLTQAWEKLRNSPLPLDHAATCGATWHQHGCTQSWLEFWKEKTKADNITVMPLSDFLGRLRGISKEFDRWGSATYMHHDCRVIAKRAIQEKIKHVEDSLPDFFVEEGI